ncbi:acetoacetate decarboxylase family protein [Thalassotalea nanhaiensis]|uniref:Acetoacetate decarboxylase family protein n=1 Tax=Thalassotalea nanhaiensis TaxID=3065648 RepID=A0ABY9TN16_9GAMM|nr:acetoacetate decarboxylase family protein [Colwelliaceae bacterium SQ345]
MGKFTVNRFGQSGPAHSPLYQVPLQVKNTTNIIYRYQADPSEIEDILPEGCELRSDGSAVVQVLVQICDHLPMPYIGTYVFPECTFDGKDYCFEYFLMVNSDVAMASGREYWGDSKKICYAEVSFESNEIYSKCQRPKGLSLVETHFRTEVQIPAEEAPEMPPGLCLKMIPNVEGKGFDVHQYVEDDAQFVPSTDAAGRYEIYKGTGSVWMPAETDVWPIHKLKPIKMLDCYLVKGDMDFNPGTILKDFNK